MHNCLPLQKKKEKEVKSFIHIIKTIIEFAFISALLLLAPNIRLNILFMLKTKTSLWKTFQLSFGNNRFAAEGRNKYIIIYKSLWCATEQRSSTIFVHGPELFKADSVGGELSNGGNVQS